MRISIASVFSFITIIARFIFVRTQHLTENNRRVIRIANGEQIDQDYYPYVVGIKINNSNDEITYCTGTLVSPQFVLTAAHCIAESLTTEVTKLNDVIIYFNYE